MKRIVLAFAVIIIFTDVFAQDPKLDRFLDVAKRIGERFNENNYMPIIDEEFDANMKKALPFEVLQPTLDNMRRQLGPITRMGKPQQVASNVAIIPVEFREGVMDMQLVLDARNRVSGLSFQVHVPPLKVPERNGTPLYYPGDGDWFVLWGGDTKDDNYHHDIQNQKYAFDLSKLGKDGRRYRTEGKTNDDFYVFGESVFAPGDGIVTEAIDGVRDNQPQSLNQYSAVGNCVIIQHSDSEYSVLAHLKQGSVKVKRGEKVSRGDVVGLVGNSGNSSEPHLHYHLQNSPILQIATGIKVYFDKLGVRNPPDPNKPLPDLYSPKKGEVVFTK